MNSHEIGLRAAKGNMGRKEWRLSTEQVILMMAALLKIHCKVSLCGFLRGL
jgi:hypothetical protein